MSPDTRSTLLPAVLFALTLAFDVLHAVLDVNRLPYGSLDALWIGLAALVLVGVPAATAFFVLSRLLARRFHNATAAALTVTITAIVLYGFVAALRSSETSVFLENHLGLTCFVSLALLALWRRPKPRLVLLAAFAVGVAVTVTAGGRNVSYASVQRQVDELRLSPVPFTGRLLLLGVDGLGWDTLQRWAAAHPGKDYEWFRRRAVLAPLNTLVPTLSPRIWSSIATGVPPEDHGVVGFTSLDCPGLWHPRLATPPFEGAFYWTRLLEALGAARRLPVSRLDLRKPPVWEILGQPSYPVDVLAWWATWPAQPLAGRMVSDRFYFSRGEPEMDADNTAAPAPERRAHSTPPQAELERGKLEPAESASDDKSSGFDSAATAGLTFPPGLAADLAPLRRAPEDMTGEELARFVSAPPAEGQPSPAAETQSEHDPRTEIRYAYTSDETWFRIAGKFLDDAPRNGTLFAYFRGVDMVSHGALRYSHLYAPEAHADREARQVYGEAVCRYYDYAFARLRELIEKAGEDTVVLIVSDHGFEPSGGGEFGHYHAPQGVFLALGGSRSGIDTTETYHVYDVAPTLLWLRGYPAGEDMPGRAHDELFPQLRAADRHTVETYGYRVVTPDASVDDARTDAEMMRLLKTLGYVK